LHDCRPDQRFKHSARDDALIRELGMHSYKGNVDGYRVGNQPNDSGVERDVRTRTKPLKSIAYAAEESSPAHRV
jgi:hypothetical protein